MTALDLLRLRTHSLTDLPVVKEGRQYVLCWLMQALRAEENPTLDAAIALGNKLELPVVVLHALENRYPYASHRLHRFILEASLELGEGIEARGLRFVRWVRRSGESEVDVVARLAERAAAVIVDDVPTFVTHTYATALAERLGSGVWGVDACCAVPMNAFERPLKTTKAFRTAHRARRETNLGTELRQVPTVSAFAEPLDLGAADHTVLAAADLDPLIATCGVDMSLPPAPDFRGYRSAALDQLAFAVREVVPRYKWTRNNPALADATAKISPWMHFGVLSPREVANAVLRAEAAGELHPAARYKFLDELLTWREYYHHRYRNSPDFSNWSGLPTWAKETMVTHAADPRPQAYTLEQLIHGETDDETWNAAQKQFLLEGWMNNNLRMYWVKQLLQWRSDPREAFAIACYLNDRLSLDGRDASTYGGIRWGFGEAKKGYRELPIYGWVAPRSSGALRRRKGVPEWLAERAALPVYRVAVPEDTAEDLLSYR
jgi:deoxyribodipyrimidine photo-lyase